jgi:hypothetical protein
MYNEIIMFLTQTSLEEHYKIWTIASQYFVLTIIKVATWKIETCEVLSDRNKIKPILTFIAASHNYNLHFYNMV